MKPKTTQTGFEQERQERLQLIASEMECYTSTDVEALYDLTANSLATMRAKGNGPGFIVLGRNVLYPKECMHAYIRAHLGQSSSKARPQKSKSDTEGLQQAAQAFANGLAGKVGKA